MTWLVGQISLAAARVFNSSSSGGYSCRFAIVVSLNPVPHQVVPFKSANTRSFHAVPAAGALNVWGLVVLKCVVSMFEGWTP